MKIHDTKLSAISDERSTTCISQFQELEHAISNLIEATELNLMDLGLAMQKQMILSSHMIERMKN